MKTSRLLTLLLVSLAVSPLTSCKDNKPTEPEVYEGSDPATLFDGYYASLESWEDYTDLRHKLYDIISKDFEAVPYKTDPYDPTNNTNWTINRTADQSLYNFDKVNVLYSDNDEFKYTGTSTNWQREHCFPASLMTGLSTGDAVAIIGTATDFHNLYASYSSGNSVHSNDCYGNVDPSVGEVTTVGNAKHQDAVTAGPNKRDAVFEPADFDKGRVARAVFYIALMYGDDNWVKKTDTAGHELSTGIKMVTRESGISCSLGSAVRGNKCHQNSEELVEWCRHIWPDRLELQHNNVVQSFQHNRNPFIDFPELVEYVYGDKRLEPGELKNLHNIRDILDLENQEVANVAVEDVTYKYDAGDVFSSSSDLKVYAVKNNLDKELISNYEVRGVADNAPLSERDNGAIVNINYGNAKAASYKIAVANSIWKELDYVSMPTANDVTLKTKPQSVVLDEVNWSFHGGEARSTSALDYNGNPIGVTLGSNSTPGGTITIESVNPISYNDKNVVNSIYIEANTGSYWSGKFDIAIYLDDELVFSQENASYSSKSKLQTYGVDLGRVGANVGKVKFVFNNVQCALNIGRIGLGLSESY